MLVVAAPAQLGANLGWPLPMEASWPWELYGPAPWVGLAKSLILDACGGIWGGFARPQPAKLLMQAEPLLTYLTQNHGIQL